MSGTPRAGRNADIKIDDSSGGAAAAHSVTSKNKWTLDQSVDTFEVTAFQDPNKSYVVGLPDGKGTIEGFWDSGDNNQYNLIGSSVARKIYIYPDAVNNVGTYFFTTAFFSPKADGATKDATNFSLSFNAAGPANWVHP